MCIRRWQDNLLACKWQNLRHFVVSDLTGTCFFSRFSLIFYYARSIWLIYTSQWQPRMRLYNYFNEIITYFLILGLHTLSVQCNSTHSRDRFFKAYLYIWVWVTNSWTKSGISVIYCKIINKNPLTVYVFISTGYKISSGQGIVYNLYWNIFIP